MVLLHFLPSSSSTISSLVSVSRKVSLQSLSLRSSLSQLKTSPSTMSINLQIHAFAGNPLSSKSPKSGDPFSPTAALETLKTRLSENNHSTSSPNFKILPFRNGRPLASTTAGPGASPPIWHLGWTSLDDLKGLLENSGVKLSGDSLVYLGSRTEDDVVYWAIDVSDERSLVPELGSRQLCFVELRTLMVATDWTDLQAMGNLAIAGHARALLEWHKITRFCGHCGEKTVPMEAGKRKQCSNESCRKRIYPRVDPVVIMLVIDRENDRALLSKQSRFVPRMWSCLAGFIEPGESLEEAVRRETWEETGIEVGEVLYHSSQPWPDAQWHSREDVRKALTFAEYKKAQLTAATRVEQMCKGVEKSQNLAADFNVESGELAPMFVPGPFAIAHHLISSWAFPDGVNGIECRSKQTSGSVSNL